MKLTPRQVAILELLYESDAPMTANTIGHKLGLDGYDIRTRDARVMGPAQRVIGSLNGLRNVKGLVTLGPRPDGLTGTAYMLTEEGERYFKEELL